MNIQRFTAATSREALAKARMTFGDGTLILSNRTTEHGVEVVATAEDTLASLERAPTASAKPKVLNQPPVPSTYQDTASKVEEDAEQLAMSTLSFQDYVRERMLRRRHEAEQTTPNESTAASAPSVAERQRPAADPHLITLHTTPVVKPRSNIPHKPLGQGTAATLPSAKGVMDELHSMKELIEDRFNAMNWLGQARQNPIQSNLMLKMIRSGYSPTLARTILERMQEELDAADSVRWVMDVLERNLHTDAGNLPLHEEGGIFALVGATGVGKTTTAAKLAGLCARTHGAASVGLITLDTYRVGAHEQLRAYGKMLGVVAHLAYDKAALHDLLGLLSNKKMILIDTTGIAPRDPRKRELLELLDLPAIKRLLVLNAGGHGDTLDEAVNCFKTAMPQQVILSKIDEAVKLGPAIDVAIRHQLLLRGVTTGQRVPEDWESALAPKLVRMSMRTTGASPYDPKIADLNFFFTPAATRPQAQGQMNA